MKKIFLTVIIGALLILQGCKMVADKAPSAPQLPPPPPTEKPAVTEYKDGFYYCEISDAVKKRISGISFDESGKIKYEDLRYLSVKYWDFEGNEQTGELIVNAELAEDVTQIFYELFSEEYKIEKIRLIDEYDAVDEKSMEDNNTSAFCYREIAGKDKLSNHALGRAIDINPLYNPYVKGDVIQPEAGAEYVDRTLDFDAKIDKDDVCYKIFTEHGWSWGGDWESLKDYQHFEKTE